MGPEAWRIVAESMPITECARGVRQRSVMGTAGATFPSHNDNEMWDGGRKRSTSRQSLPHSPGQAQCARGEGGWSDTRGVQEFTM